MKGELGWFERIKNMIMVPVFVGALVFANVFYVEPLKSQNALLVSERDTAKSTVAEMRTVVGEKDQKIKELTDSHNNLRTQLNSVQPNSSLIVLEPTWVNKDGTIPALYGQILIKNIMLVSALRTASFEIRISKEEPVKLGLMTEGERKSFQYEGHDYYFDMLKTDIDKVYISIVRRL